jgi:hypothetical protein
MQIELRKITVRELVDGYVDNGDDGVFGYGGRLDIRPPYQREFIYPEKDRNAVIDTVRKGFPLNSIYWVKSGEQYEMLDGQQRTVSICQYVHGDFSMPGLDGNPPQYFNGLPSDQKEKILGYELQVYFCEGTDSEKLDWFKVINTVGKKLTEQEARNAVYAGPWLSGAKLTFSKPNCAAYCLGEKYINGSPIRQEFLETAIDWISDGNVEEYMASHKLSPNASELWLHFQAVIAWVKAVFPVYRKEMKGLRWGDFYNRFHGQFFDSAELENRIKTLMMDDDVTKKSGVYEYVLTGDDKHLNIRAFSESMKRGAYERQSGVCAMCKKPFDFLQMQGDHITPWCDGGKTITENCQMLCKDCNRRKGGN